MWIGPLIGVVFAILARRWWAYERGRQLIAGVATGFCVLMGLTLVAITAAVGWEEQGFGTLVGGPHGPRMLILTLITGLFGLTLLGLGAHLGRLIHRGAV